MTTIVKPSRCGSYVAKASLAAGSVDVFYLDGADRIYRTYDLVRVVGGYRGRRTEVLVVQMEWAEDEKIAVLVEEAEETLGPELLLVLELIEDRAPIIFDQSEGIDSFEWIPCTRESAVATGVPADIEDSRLEGAYSGNIQLAVFTKLRLQLNIYSLDCSHILFTIPKPISLILSHPTSNIWSILVQPYFGKNSNVMARANADNNPILLHFHSQGSISRLIYRLRLPMSPLTVPQLSWSPSGHWLLYFNENDSLFGYDLQVFNSLGIYKKSIIPDTDAVVSADTVFKLSCLTDGIVDDVTSSSLVSFGSSKYFSKWLTLDNLECLLICNRNNDYSGLEFTVISTTSFKIVQRGLLLGTDITSVWRIHDKKSYRSVLVPKLRLDEYNEVVDVLMMREFVGFQFNSLLLVYKVLYDTGVEWEFITAVNTNSGIIAVDSLVVDEELHVVITTKNHILAYNVDQKYLRVIPSQHRIKSSQIVQVNDQVKLILTDDLTQSSLNHWHVVQYSDNGSDDSNAQIMKQYEYKEDDAKVVNLMNDVQHSEWGTRARFRRNRFSDVGLGIPSNGYLTNINSDDITDTFNLHRKRQRRS